MVKNINHLMVNSSDRLEKIIMLLLSIFLSYLVTYKFFFITNEGGRNFGYIYFFILIILIYFFSQYLINFFIFSVKFVTKIINKKFDTKDFIIKKYVVTPLILLIGFITIVLFFVSIYYVGLYWKIRTLNEFDLIGLAINDKILSGTVVISILYLIISEFFILNKYGKIAYAKSFLIGILHSSFIMLSLYAVTKIVYILLTVVMIIIGLLLFGIRG